MLLTPLEQFQIISLFSIKLFCLDFSITNLFLILLIVFIFFVFLLYCITSDDTSFFLAPNNWQRIYMRQHLKYYLTILIKKVKIFSFVSILFLFILLVNLRINSLQFYNNKSFNYNFHIIIYFYWFKYYMYSIYKLKPFIYTF